MILFAGLMAKKKRIVEKEKEVEYEFIPPDFDEREFILKDMFGTKITMVVFVLALVVGFCASCLDKIWEWYGGLLLMFVVLFGLKQFLKMINLDPDLIETKSMIGNYLLFILLSLGIWILFINAPFA